MKINCLIYVVFLFVLFSALPNQLQAGQLPIKTYTTFDGLANDSVNKIVLDSRGFLWFCTGEGLSRFDGFEFKNYTQNEGLPHRRINDFLETKDGDFLVATGDGLSIFNPNGAAYRWNVLTGTLEQNSDAPPMFRTFFTPNPNNIPKARSIYNLTESADGKIFAGTGKGLFQLEKSGNEWSFHQIESEIFTENTEFSAAKFDSAGYLWLVTNLGIYRMSPDKIVKEIGGDGAGSILLDHRNQIWIGASGRNSGLRLYTISENGQTVELTKTYRIADGLPEDGSMADLRQTSDGRILVAVGKTLCEFTPGAAENDAKFRIIARGNFESLGEDGGGNLWLGTTQEGAWKMFPGGLVKYDEADGVPNADITSLYFNRAGEFFVTSGTQNILRLNGDHFESIVPNGLKSRSWGINNLGFQNADGEWWMSSKDGLRVYDKPRNFNDLSRNAPKKVYGQADGLSYNEVFNLFEDSRGDVWINTIYGPFGLQRWEKKTGQFISYTDGDGLPKDNGVIAFGEDSAGNVWFGFYFGGLARYKDGKFRFFTAKDGIPEGPVKNFFTDKENRLWIATASRGVFRVNQPNDENPQFVNLSAAQGLSSNQTNCVTEDDFGQIYIGTGNGIDRLNPQTGNIKFYTQSDGLPGSVVSLCRRAPNGALWFVSKNNLIKFAPPKEVALKTPAVYIGSISVNGEPEKISELGAENIGRMNLESDRHQIKIEFFALGFGAGERLRYQYKLNNQDWSEPDEQKSVTLNLASGEYQFSVRAVNADNAASEKPATVSFKIAVPLWRRWWVLTLGALLLAAGIFALDRYRVKKTRQVETALEISRESAERFRTLAQTASDAIITVNKESRIVFVNDAVENIFGYAEKELIGADLTMLMPEGLRGAHNSGMKQYMETDEKRISWAAIELPGKHKDGREIPLELSFGEFSSGGERYFTGIARDVSERKKSGEALQQAFGKLSVSENRFRQLNEQSPLGTVIFAPDGSIRAINHAYEEFWGVTFEQIEHWDFLADEQIIKSGVADKLRPVFSGETMSLPPIPYDPQTNSAGIKVDENAEVRWIQSFAYPVKSDAGELLEVVLVMEDVTDSKRAAEIEQKAKTDRLRELEQVRRRIAADLHDDIGSSLTQISIFSEVLQQRIDKSNERVLEPLEFIAGSSRELVDAMSDIVWAINPQKDSLSELTGKMRRFAADVFSARNIQLKYEAFLPDDDLALGANLRREVFLIFKESVNNIVKHANCTRVEISLTVENSEIRLSLHDNGAGFKVDKMTDGHGLISMKQRAAGLNGKLEMVSNAENGTTTTLQVSLDAKRNEKVL